MVLLMDRLSASVLIVGMGGLGCPVALTLVQAGVKRLTLMDPDRVDVSNLHRQLWFRTADVGQLKVDAAAARIKAAFPGISIRTWAKSLEQDNAFGAFKGHDLVIDGTDRIDSKFLLSDLSVRTGIPVVFGGVLRMTGQVMLIRPPGPCLRCLFEEPPSINALPSCSSAGVLGSVPGVIGTLQGIIALSALRGEELPSELMVFEAGTLTQRFVPVHKRADCVCSGIAAPSASASAEAPA
jgi:adenylyltransferase/sulfurtransferase